MAHWRASSSSLNFLSTCGTKCRPLSFAAFILRVLEDTPGALHFSLGGSNNFSGFFGRSTGGAIWRHRLESPSDPLLPLPSFPPPIHRLDALEQIGLEDIPPFSLGFTPGLPPSPWGHRTTRRIATARLDVRDRRPLAPARCNPPRRHAHVPLFPGLNWKPGDGTPTPPGIYAWSGPEAKKYHWYRICSGRESGTIPPGGHGPGKIFRCENAQGYRRVIPSPYIGPKKALNAFYGVNTFRPGGKTRGSVIAGGPFRRTSSARKRAMAPVPIS
jgi:hypothetical protein